MQAKIIELINLLIKISGQKDNIKNLNEELSYLDNLLPELKKELDTLSNSINDDKYFDASSEIIDRNIELSLKKKINNLQIALDKQKDRMHNANKKAVEVNSKWELLNKRISSCEAFISILNSRFQSENNTDSDSKYFKLLEDEKKRYESLNAELIEVEKQKEELQNSILDLEKTQEELTNNLNSEKVQLEEVQQSLATKSSYIDKQRKEEDLNRVKDLEIKIENTSKRKNEILNSVIYKAEEAKELLLNSDNDKTAFLEKINLLVNELNQLPYQKIDDDVILKEELQQLESKKDELTTLIENKNYVSSDLNIIEQRLNYLDGQKSRIAAEIEAYQKIDQTIDNEEIIKLTDILVDLRNQAKNFEINIESISKDESLGEEYEFELEKYHFLNELITQYENDLQDLILLSNNLNNVNIVNCRNQLEKIENEFADLNKKKLLYTDSLDVIEKEKDRKELRLLLENIEQLNLRIEIGITPNQILDQIEMLLFAGDDVKNRVNEKLPETPVTETEVIKNINLGSEGSLEQTFQSVQPEFTFEKLTEDNDLWEDKKALEKEKEDLPNNVEIFNNSSDDNKDFSFSPLDNTGFISFDDALNLAKNE